MPSHLHPYASGALLELADPEEWEQVGDMTPEDVAAIFDAALEEYFNGMTYRVGTLAHYITSTPPDGILPCDGGTYNDVDYPTLAARLDPVFDNGNGTFTLPDLRGRAVIGEGKGATTRLRTLNESGGEEAHVLTLTEMPNHAHQYNSPGLPDIVVVAPGEFPAQSTNTVGTTTFVGNGQAHENMPPYYVAYVGVWYA